MQILAVQCTLFSVFDTVGTVIGEMRIDLSLYSLEPGETEDSLRGSAKEGKARIDTTNNREKYQ